MRDREKERARDRLARYEKRMGFRTGRDRISLAAFPESQTDDCEWDRYNIGDGRRWVNAPAMEDEDRHRLP